MALKPSLQYHQTFVKVGFPDKVTGLWAFEGQIPYQKFQGPPIKVSKSRKQNTKISNTPKNQRNFVHFFALVSKSGSIKKIKALYGVR